MLLAGVLVLLTYLAMSPAFWSHEHRGFIAFISNTAMMAKPIRSLTEVNATIPKGIAATKSFFSLFDEPTELDTGTKVLTQAKGNIEFDAVSFYLPLGPRPGPEEHKLAHPRGQDGGAGGPDRAAASPRSPA
jgi:subfamily B ATP-binding cassette protein MsbA